MRAPRLPSVGRHGGSPPSSRCRPRYRRARVLTFLDPDRRRRRTPGTRSRSRSSRSAAGASTASASARAARSGSSCRTRTPTSSSPSSVRSSVSSGPSSCSRSSSRSPSSAIAHRAARARPVRDAPRRGHHRLGRRPGRGQHRWRRRAAARVRHPAAVRVVRRLVARVHDGRAPGSWPTSLGSHDDRAARARARVFALVTGWRHRRSRVPGARGRRRARAARPRARERSTSSARSADSRRRAVPAAGFTIDLLPGRGLRRSLRPSALRDNFGARRRTRAGVHAGASGSSVGRDRASCFGVGGYASLPCVVAARLRQSPGRRARAERAPGPGQPHRGAARGARRGLAPRHAACAVRCVTGNPIRPEIARSRRAPGRPPLVAVVRREPRCAAHQRRDARRSTTAGATAPTSRCRHVAGPARPRRCRDTARTSCVAARVTGSTYELVAYEDAHGQRVRTTPSVVVCRAGAVTVAELAVDGHAVGARAAARGARATTRRRTPRRWSRRAPRCSCPTRELDGARLAARARRRCSATRRGSRRWASAARALAPPRRRRARRRPRRGGCRVAA